MKKYDVVFYNYASGDIKPKIIGINDFSKITINQGLSKYTDYTNKYKFIVLKHIDFSRRIFTIQLGELKPDRRIKNSVNIICS